MICIWSFTEGKRSERFGCFMRLSRSSSGGFYKPTVCLAGGYEDTCISVFNRIILVQSNYSCKL